jgi:hypothetical protein
VIVSTVSVAVPNGTPPRNVPVDSGACGVDRVPCSTGVKGAGAWAAALALARTSSTISGTGLTKVPFSSAGARREGALAGRSRSSGTDVAIDAIAIL